MIQKFAEFRRRRNLRNALINILETEDGKTFFRHFLKVSGVTQTSFTLDPQECLARENTRRIAMMYLNLVAGDDPTEIIHRLEEEAKQQQNTED